MESSSAAATMRRKKAGNSNHRDERKSSLPPPPSPPPEEPPSLWLTFGAYVLYDLSLRHPRICSTAERCFLVVAILPPVAVGILVQRILKTASNSKTKASFKTTTDTNRTFATSTSLFSMSSNVFFYIYTILLFYLLWRMFSHLLFCWKTAQAYFKNRIDASEATLTTRRRASQQTSSSSSPRVVFGEGYDLYLPPPPALSDDTTAATRTDRDANCQNHVNHSDDAGGGGGGADCPCQTVPCGFFLFPGALVDYRCYTAVAVALSDQGIAVVVQNTEPFRLVAWIYGSHDEFARKTMKQVQERHSLHVQEWNVGGHSMGGYTCFNLVQKLPGVFQKLVFYGVYRPLPLKDAGVDVLAVTASCDGFRFQNEKCQQAFFDSLPPLRSSSSSSPLLSSKVESSITASTSSTSSSTSTSAAEPCSNSNSNSSESDSNRNRTVHCDIQGGNHAGFGDYEIQTFPLMDDKRTISLQEQHAQMAKVTSDFLLNK